MRVISIRLRPRLILYNLYVAPHKHDYPFKDFSPA